VAAKKPSARPSAIGEWIGKEELLGLYDAATYARLQRFKDGLRKITRDLVGSLKAGAKVASYGASATSTVLSQELGFAADISFVIDDNPLRQRTLSPGFLAPVCSRDELERAMPDLLIVSAWRFSDGIIANCRNYLQKGGRIYVPLPLPRIVTFTSEEFLEVPQ
jgi:hypothetical protein